MENYPGGLKSYWKSRAYERLDGTSPSSSPFGRCRRRLRRKTQVVQLHGRTGEQAAAVGRKPRRFWRLRIKPRLRFLRKAITSPRWLLSKIRDGYVHMMLRLANSPALGAYGGGDFGVAGFSRPAVKEYDEKVLVEIYKSLVAQGHILAAAAAGKDGVPTGRIVAPS